MSFEDLKNAEFQEKLKNASTPEELMTLVKEEGYELTDEELEGVSGGIFWGCGSDCPQDYPEPNHQEITITDDNITVS